MQIYKIKSIKNKKTITTILYYYHIIQFEYMCINLMIIINIYVYGQTNKCV